MGVTGGDTARVQLYPNDTVGVDPYSIGVAGTTSGLNDKLIKKNNTWVSGSLASMDPTQTIGFMQTYGYFEASIRFAPGPATWDAFWFGSPRSSYSGGEGNEADIEFYGSAPTQLFYNLHEWKECPSTGQLDNGSGGCVDGSGSDYGLPDLTQAFHTYGFLWTPTTLSFYIDNALRWSTPRPIHFTTPMEILLDNGIGSGQPTLNQPSGADFKVKYVHVYAPGP